MYKLIYSATKYFGDTDTTFMIELYYDGDNGYIARIKDENGKAELETFTLEKAFLVMEMVQKAMTR